jgi:hypothetical protein
MGLWNFIFISQKLEKKYVRIGSLTAMSQTGLETTYRKGQFHRIRFVNISTGRAMA